MHAESAAPAESAVPAERAVRDAPAGHAAGAVPAEDEALAVHAGTCLHAAGTACHAVCAEGAMRDCHQVGRKTPGHTVLLPHLSHVLPQDASVAGLMLGAWPDLAAAEILHTAGPAVKIAQHEADAADAGLDPHQVCSQKGGVWLDHAVNMACLQLDAVVLHLLHNHFGSLEAMEATGAKVVAALTQHLWTWPVIQ